MESPFIIEFSTSPILNMVSFHRRILAENNIKLNRASENRMLIKFNMSSNSNYTNFSEVRML